MYPAGQRTEAEALLWDDIDSSVITSWQAARENLMEFASSQQPRGLARQRPQPRQALIPFIASSQHCEALHGGLIGRRARAIKTAIGTWK